MNEYDSLAVENLLEKDGWESAELEDAQLVIVNTCAVRQNAEERAIGRLLTIAGTYPEKIVGIIGCVAKEKGADLLKKYNKIRFAVGPGEIDRIPEIVSEKRKKQVLLIEDRITGCELRAKTKKDQIKAFISITRGCENYCSYCIVPYVRGKLISRPYDDILDEIKNNIYLGVKEITLLGQNVNSYYDQKNNVDFADLLYKIYENTELLRLRYLTNHPKDMSDKIIEAITNIQIVCESIHLPIQSGSNKILKKMNRGYTIEEYKLLVSKIKNKMNNVALSTDIITGFPGESDADFNDTVSIYHEIKYSSSFSFRYSVRPGTKAAKMHDSVPESIKIERLKEIINIGQEYSNKFSKEQIGKTVEVLVEGRNLRKNSEYIGTDRAGRKVSFKTNIDVEDPIVYVKIYDAQKWLLLGNIVDSKVRNV